MLSYSFYRSHLSYRVQNEHQSRSVHTQEQRVPARNIKVHISQKAWGAVDEGIAFYDVYIE